LSPYKIPKYQRAVVGGHLGGKRYGYRIVEGQGGEKALEPDPTEQNLIHDVVEMKQRGATLSKMREYLQSQGRPLSTKGISRLLMRLPATPNLAIEE
jgi:hypothetical protein